jgi:hypothetical protein
LITSDEDAPGTTGVYGVAADEGPIESISEPAARNAATESFANMI